MARRRRLHPARAKVENRFARRRARWRAARSRDAHVQRPPGRTDDPHTHGSVAYQMANGMAGALIVEGRSPSGNVRDLEEVPEIAPAKERIFVLQQLILRKDEHGVGRVDPNDVYTETPSPDAYQVTTINGVVLPTYYMQPSEVQRWRCIHAGREEPIVLRWRHHRDQPMRAKSIVLHQIVAD